MTYASLDHVTKTFGDITALASVNVQVRPGEVLAVLGPNGAGKTTIIRLLLGLIAPDRGHVTVLGADPRHSANRTRTGAMLQVGKVPETLRVAEHIDLFSSYYPAPFPLQDTIAAAGLTGLESRQFGELSGGQKQRLLFALAICGNPDLVYLDEPTVGFDVEARRCFWEQVRALVARGKAVLLTTHYLHEADALADRIVVINKGTVIAEGTPAEIKARTAGRCIRCVSALDDHALSAIPGVLDIRRDREALLIHASEAEPVLRELLLRDPTVAGIEVTTAGLEEAFLALTHDPEPQATHAYGR